MNGSDATHPHAGFSVIGFSIPPADSRSQAPGRVRRSQTEAMPTISAQPRMPSHPTLSEHANEPGWRHPNPPLVDRKPTLSFPEPSNLGASNIERPLVFDNEPYAHLFSGSSYILTQNRPHGLGRMPEPSLYPVDEESRIHDLISDFRTTYIAEEPQMMTPESATSTLPPVTPGYSDFAPEIDPIKGDMLEAAVEDIEVVKKIFCGWYDQLYTEL